MKEQGEITTDQFRYQAGRPKPGNNTTKQIFCLKSGYGVQLVLFTDLLPNGKKQESNRRTYTTHDIRMVKQDYTHGWIKGPEMAEKLGVPYPSFKQFVKRNPDLKKGYHTKLSPFSAT